MTETDDMAKSRESVHHDEYEPSASDSHSRLHLTDEMLGRKLDELADQMEAEKELNRGRDKTTDDIRKYMADQVASTKKAVIGIWASAIAVITMAIGGVGAFEYSRRELVSMRADLGSVKESSHQSALDIALIQRDLRPIDSLKAENTALELRVRELERLIDRTIRQQP